MGNSESIKQKELSDFIQWQQTCLKLDQSTLIRFFREEFSQVVTQWNIGKVTIHDFKYVVDLFYTLQAV